MTKAGPKEEFGEIPAGFARHPLNPDALVADLHIACVPGDETVRIYMDTAPLPPNNGRPERAQLNTLGWLLKSKPGDMAHLLPWVIDYLHDRNAEDAFILEDKSPPFPAGEPERIATELRFSGLIIHWAPGEPFAPVGVEVSSPWTIEHQLGVMWVPEKGPYEVGHWDVAGLGWKADEALAYFR